MIKKTITYNEYDGSEVTSDFYFHLNKREVMKLTVELGAKYPIGKDATFADILAYMAEHSEVTELFEFIEHVILMSVGERSADGKRFTKNKEITEAFENSNAFGELFELIITDPDKSKAFAEGIVKGGGNTLVEPEIKVTPNLTPVKGTPNIQEELDLFTKEEPEPTNFNEMTKAELIKMIEANNKTIGG